MKNKRQGRDGAHLVESQLVINLDNTFSIFFFFDFDLCMYKTIKDSTWNRGDELATISQ